MATSAIRSIDDLAPYLVGRGTERLCFRNPGNPKTILKLSALGKTKQTDREAAYFAHLQRRGVPFDHLPEYFGPVEVPGYAGFEQELVVDCDGTISLPFQEFVTQPNAGSALSKTGLLAMLQPLEDYLARFCICTCDIGRTNVVIQQQAPGRFRPVLVDGIGDTDFIPICRILPCMARRKTRRHWMKFLRRSALA